MRILTVQRQERTKWYPLRKESKHKGTPKLNSGWFFIFRDDAVTMRSETVWEVLWAPSHWVSFLTWATWDRICETWFLTRSLEVSWWIWHHHDYWCLTWPWASDHDDAALTLSIWAWPMIHSWQAMMIRDGSWAISSEHLISREFQKMTVISWPSAWSSWSVFDLTWGWWWPSWRWRLTADPAGLPLTLPLSQDFDPNEAWWACSFMKNDGLRLIWLIPCLNSISLMDHHDGICSNHDDVWLMIRWHWGCWCLLSCFEVKGCWRGHDCWENLISWCKRGWEQWL